MQAVHRASLLAQAVMHAADRIFHVAENHHAFEAHIVDDSARILQTPLAR